MTSPPRPGFCKWIDDAPDPGWNLLPLTHISSGLIAQDIAYAMSFKPGDPDGMGGPYAYFFYGRPAYRASKDTTIGLEAACPFCFILDSDLIAHANELFAFDTGAFNHRLYKNVLTDDFSVHDFSLGVEPDRINKLIARSFGNLKEYLGANRAALSDVELAAEAWEMEARSYLTLLSSPGRNEPDDRVCSIEVLFSDPVPLLPHLKAVIVPHTLWNHQKKAPWLADLNGRGVEIIPFTFMPMRHPEHYQTLIEISVQELYGTWGLL